MQAIILLPMIVTVVALFRRSLAQVFLWVYLPVLLLLPMYFAFKPAYLPPITFCEAVLLPFGIALLYREWRQWQWTSADLGMLFYLLSAAVCYFQVHNTTVGLFDLFHATLTAFVPYSIGKLLLEQQDLRTRTVREMVYLVAGCCIIAELEYFRGTNPFADFWARFFPDQPLIWTTQMRWGFGRVAGPYAQSELAGMVLFVTLVLAIWAGYAHPWAKKLSWVPQLFQTRTLFFLILAVALFTTQARGPWLGCMLAVPIALLGRTRHLLRNGVAVVLLCLTVGTVTYAVGREYTETHAIAATDEQQTAQYRRHLLDAYIPIAKEGGAWGFGRQFPVVPATDSIDNEYLFLWLTQGWIGLGSFLLMSGDTLFRLGRAIVNGTGKRDRFFALSLLGIMCGLLLTIGTVFLSHQPFQLFFLVVGWSQGLSVRQARPHKRSLAFAHVLT